jgi:tRNA U34 2-thiouridine synthase MnmA/TrmU
MAEVLVLFSGGLDSLLAAKLLQAQNLDVIGLCFASNFYNGEKAEEAACSIGLPLVVEDISPAMLELAKRPPSGYGKNLNPCIDCHALMARQAGQIARKRGAEVVATGEVLGQRPFSQTREALKRVDELAGVEILRPLSAQCLPETAVEKKGIVDRSRLLGIKGRGRQEQLRLVGEFGIKAYESPSGGCLLTDKIFADRLSRMLEYWPDCDVNDVELLKNGRVFWFRRKIEAGADEKVFVVVGRHEADNYNLEKLAQAGDVMVQLKDLNGPTTLIRTKGSGLPQGSAGEMSLVVPNEFEYQLEYKDISGQNPKSPEEIVRLAALYTGFYSPKARGSEVGVEARIY